MDKELKELKQLHYDGYSLSTLSVERLFNHIEELEAQLAGYSMCNGNGRCVSDRIEELEAFKAVSVAMQTDRQELQRKYDIALHLAHSWGNYYSVEAVEEEINRTLLKQEVRDE